MPVSKVLYGNKTLIDLTQDTVRAERLHSGYTAHGGNGELITGTGQIYSEGTDIMPIEFDYNAGYIGLRQTENLVNLLYFAEENPSQCYSDVYELTAGKSYSLSLDSIVGSRFRAGLGKTYTTYATRVNGSPAITLHQVIFLNGAPAANQKVYFSNNMGDGAYPYLIVQKDNQGQRGLITHLRELTM